MSDQYSLAGKVAAATVARQGKGRAIDIGLGAAGARVAVTDCVPESASSAAADIVAAGGTAFPVTPEVNSKALAAEFAALGPRGTERLRAVLRRHVPLGRMGPPQDPAGAAVFSASESASCITGATIPLNGGYLAL